jgi:hypothetical protein
MSAEIPLLYFLLVFSWIMLFVSFYKKDYWLVAVSGIVMSVIGIWVTSNGLDGVRNLLSLAIGISHLLIGVYLLLRSIIEVIQVNMP